jgi:mono/diheme cytochrome c family protein
MKKVLLLGTLVWVSTGVAVSFGWKAPAAPTASAVQPVAQPQPVAQAQTPAPAQAAAARPTAASATAEYRQLVDKYCVTCHNQRLNLPAGAPLYLDQASLDDIGAHAQTWEKVVRKLGVGAMPPTNMPTPGDEKLAEFRGWLQSSLDRAANVQRNPGRYTLHRLNRAEYANAVRDMLGVEVDVTELLPSDGANFGFDNVASGLTMSPLLLERYLTAALRIASYAVGDTGVAAGASVYPISLEVTQKDHVDGLPLGTRGGIKVRHIFPADAEYEFSGQLNRTILNGFSGIEGHEKPHDFVVLIDGNEVFRTAVGGPEDHKENAADPTNTGLQRIIDRLRSRVPVTAGAHDVVFTWIEKPNREQSVWLMPLRDTQEVHHAGGPPRLKTVTVEGPYNPTGISTTASRERIFVCRPTAAAQEAACAQRIFSNLGRRAFRRPVTAEDIEGPLTFYRQTREQGGNFDAGIRAGVARILASPSFLFRAETSPAALQAGAAHRVTDLELASRLSFFLWSSIPDDQLLNLAIAGRLRAPGVLEAQVRRMVADERANAMVANFTGQWLQLRNLENRVNPDILLFPDFDDNVRKAFRRETEMLFEHIMRENLSALDLLSADYTFVNERLARHYGISNVYGARFRRIQLTDQNRRGLLGHGSILSLTSVANRTSPTIRGKYVMATLLNTPPLPPPPNVPELEASKEEGKATTVRQQLERHRANAVCASCHRNIDPIGFALENFDPTGRWREQTPDGLKVDNVGTLVDGREVNGPVQLRQALLTNPEIFVTALTENMLIYALGRGLEPSDMAVVRSVVRSSGRDNYRFMSIVMGIVQSAPFQMRTKLATATETRVAQSN